MAVAEPALTPALRRTPTDTPVVAGIVADGFSCQTQIAHLQDGGPPARHLAEVIDAAMGSNLMHPSEEDTP
ncbi:hypothetical protein [Streptomyces melanosporofaciens]|uniref:hypothetical protein n=1 Tax=Streptomyces melanosporofaciens TaxID=67327 RepID=UPI000B816E1E|nr:hypothetical protein [Streptomyces melanosporofaciens]